ncbi:glycosyltransferase family 39 protein [Litorihabitans aurantiacus]|uniref:Glycosyltransferase RgtA/B/C/D-like domain-containing protein n=1 Tax=Litorihabitans aurantiacus TaxID=1930061 RepID=A0AA37XGR5_9MICO|nr:glycosyltransferase family 39 protein [Litorihabitans aurantiacus]GMA33046.1 hypothetical protein GCM10025875_30380 [Litorihabitans aurantiacus]
MSAGTLVRRPRPGRAVPLPQLPTPPAAAPAPRAGTTAEPAPRRSARDLLTADRVTAAVTFAVALAVGLWNVTDATAFQDDEGTYAAQAAAAASGGFGPYTYWYDHPPLGWFQLAALAAIPRALGIGDGSELALMRAVAGLLLAVTALLVLLVLRRLAAPRTIALVAVALLLTSPLALTLGRQVFLDNVATPWLLLAVWLALSPRRALWAHAGAGAALGVAVLTKLTSLALGPAVLVALLAGGRWRGRSFSLTAFLTAASLVVTVFPLMALLRTELLAGDGHVSLQEGLEFQLADRSTSGSFWDGATDRHALVIGWVGQSPLLVVAGVLGAIACLTAARTRWLPVALACLALPMIAMTGYLPGMYVVGTLPFLAIAAGAGAARVWGALTSPVRARVTAGRGWRIATAGVAVATIAALGAAVAPSWRAEVRPLATARANDDFREAVAWVETHVPASDDVVVPFSAWSAVQEQGRGGPWNVIALEKVDRDSAFEAAHPDGWRSVEWILEGPTTRPNIDNLALADVGSALESSEVVATFGAWSVHRVTPSALERQVRS